MNLFSYVKNNSVNLVDPYGLLVLADDAVFWTVVGIGVGGYLIYQYFSRRNGLNWGAPYPPLRPGRDMPYRGPSYGSPRNPLDPRPKPKLPWWAYPPLMGPGFGAASLYCAYHPDASVCKELDPDKKKKDNDQTNGGGGACPLPSRPAGRPDSPFANRA